MFNGKVEEFICYCIKCIVSYDVKQANNKEITLCSITNLQMKNEKRKKDRKKLHSPLADFAIEYLQHNNVFERWAYTLFSIVSTLPTNS